VHEDEDGDNSCYLEEGSIGWWILVIVIVVGRVYDMTGNENRNGVKDD